MLINHNLGEPIQWTIGNQATGKTDTWPGRLVRVDHDSTDDRGRRGTIAVCILERLNLQGEKYLAVARILELYVDPRAYRIPELDTPSVPQLLAKIADARQAVFQRGQGVEIGTPTGEAVDATVSDDVPLEAAGTLPF